MRLDGCDSSGYKKHVSPGTVRASIRQDPYLRGLIRDEGRWSRLEYVYAGPDLLLSDIDLMDGSSGGPLVDSSGRLAGLTWGSIARSADEELHATAPGLRIETLRRETEAALGKDEARKVFSCPGAPPSGAGPSSGISARLGPLLRAAALADPSPAFDGRRTP